MVSCGHFGTEKQVKLTAEVPPPPSTDGDSLALAGRGVGLNGVTDCREVAVVLTGVESAVLEEGPGAQLLVTFLERPLLGNDDAAEFLGSVLACLLLWTLLAAAPHADRRAARRRADLPALAQLLAAFGGPAVGHGHVVRLLLVVVAAETADRALVGAGQGHAYRAAPVKGHGDASGCPHHGSPSPEGHVQFIVVIQRQKLEIAVKLGSRKDKKQIRADYRFNNGLSVLIHGC